MEQNGAIISIDSNNIPKEILPAAPVKKGGSKNIFKVMLFMMRSRSSRKSKVLPINDDSRSIWRKLVGSMRPLHLQSNQCLRPQIDNNNSNNNDNDDMVMKKKMITTIEEMPSCDHIQSEDVFDSASPSPASSRYASAVGLNEMVKDQEEEEVENVVKDNKDNNEGDGDDMIDAKAEEFIAQFYKQMRLQRLDIVDRRYEEISMRSLGL